MFKLEIKGKEYLFEVVRRSLRVAEKNGIELSSMNGLSGVYDMFFIALVKYQPDITLEEAYDLFDALLDEGDYDTNEVIELIGKGFEELFSKMASTTAKKKIIAQ